MRIDYTAEILAAEELLGPDDADFLEDATPVARTFTDVGLAQRYVRDNQGRLLAVRGQGLYGYDPRRGIFTGDRIDLVRWAKKTARGLYTELSRCHSDAEEKDLLRFARVAQSKRGIDAALALAETEEAIQCEPADLDADPGKFKAADCVIDLRTGDRLKNDPAHLMTRRGGAAYEPDAACPVWLAHLERIFAGDGQMIAFLQRLLGYGITGLNVEQIFPIAYGDGANGKGVTLKAYMGVLGSYGATASFQTFSQNRPDAIRNDLAALAGARFVSTSESRAGQPLDEAIIKQITGGDAITARFLHHELFTYQPQFLVMLSTNHKPRITTPDYAIKRRVLLLPFEVTIPEPEQDRRLAEKLALESAGILAWCVAGAVAYFEHGLAVPDKVKAATETYREEMDPLKGFRDDCCVLEPGAWTPTLAIRRSLEAWARDEHLERIPNHKELAEWLGQLGCTPEKHRGERGWTGIRLDGSQAVQRLEVD